MKSENDIMNLQFYNPSLTRTLHVTAVACLRTACEPRNISPVWCAFTIDPTDVSYLRNINVVLMPVNASWAMLGD